MHQILLIFSHSVLMYASVYWHGKTDTFFEDEKMLKRSIFPEIISTMGLAPNGATPFGCHEDAGVS